MTGPMPPDDLSFEDPGFDALDTAIGERLRAAAPTAPDVDATLAGLQPGFARAATASGRGRGRGGAVRRGVRRDRCGRAPGWRDG